MEQIVFAGEKRHERLALVRDVVADRPTPHPQAGLQRVEDGGLRARSLEFLEAKYRTVGPKTQVR